MKRQPTYKQLGYASVLFLPVLLASCMPDWTKNIPCSSDNECPTGYFCSDLKCSKGTNPGTTEFTVAPEQEIKFGELQNGTSKQLQALVTNVAQSNASIKVKAVIESGGDVFKVSPSDFVVIPPKSQSGSQSFSVTFSPPVGTLGTLTGSLSFTVDEPWRSNPQKVTIKLSGLSTDPKLVYSPTDIDFNKDGDQDIAIRVNADISYSKSVTVQNNGSPDSTLTINDIVVNDSYNGKLALANLPALPTKLAAGEQFKFDIVLRPKDAFAANTKVVIKSDDIDKLTGNVNVKAQVFNCDSGWYDTIDKPNCMCQGLPRGGPKCAAAEQLKYLPEKPYLKDTDKTFIFVDPANLVPNEEKWFTFGAEDDMGFEVTWSKDPFHVRIELVQGADYDENIVMEVYSVKDKTSWKNFSFLCGDPLNGLCDESQCGNMLLNLDKYNIGGLDKQIVDFYTDLMIMGSDSKPVGECPCDPVINPDLAPNNPNINRCRDDSQRFYIKVHRKEGAVTLCKGYKLSISNGFYAQDMCK